jgi:replicative DNA helicase
MSLEQLQDVAAERAVLAGIFQYGEDAYLDVADFVQPSTFTDPANQAAYKSIIYLYEKQGIKTFDQSSLMAALSSTGNDWVLQKSDEIKHIRSLMNGRVALENVRMWGAQIRKLEIARLLRNQLLSACTQVENITGTEPIDQILGIGESAIFDFTTLLHNEEQNEPIPIWSNVDEVLDELESNPVDIVGISSGMSYYDQSIGGGFRRKTVSLIGARQKTGKSMLAVNIGLHVSGKSNIPVLYVDTEMIQRDHLGRLLPNLALEIGGKITITEWETGRYAKDEFKKRKIREAAEKLKQFPFYYINVSGKPFEEIVSIMRRWITKTVGFDDSGKRKNCLIIFDYLKMISGETISESLKEYQILGFMTSTLHNFAVRADAPICAFTQLNRDGIDDESSGVISGSDRILNTVTNFTIYKQKTPEEIADGPEHGNRKLVPICARHGEGLQPGDYINISFSGKYGKITENETKYNLKNKKVSQAPAQDVDNIPT